MTHRCPDEETLAAYFDGLLSPDDELALHAEMLACPDCLELIGALGLVLRDEDPDAWTTAPPVPAAVTERAVALWPDASAGALDPGRRPDGIVRIAIRWLGDRLEPLVDALAPLPAPAVSVRGAADSAGAREDLRYQVTLGDLPLEVDLETEGPQRLALTVRPLRPPPAGALLRLATAGETRALSSLTPDGTTLAALAPGSYDLILEHRDRALGHIHLALTV